MPEQPFDVRKVIDQSAAKTTLQDLARKGIHRVKVLDEAMINKLIRDAVEHILVSKTGLLSDEDREKVIQESRKELDKLVKEFNEQKDKAELATKDKAVLASDVENLQKQLSIQRQLGEQLGRQRFEDGRRAAQEEIDALKTRMGQLDGEIAARTRRELEGELQRKLQSEMEKMSAMASQLEAMKKTSGEDVVRRAVEKAENDLKEQFRSEFPKRVAAAVEAREKELKLQYLEREKELRGEAERRYEEGVRSQKPVIEQLEKRTAEAALAAAREKDAEYTPKLMAEMQKNVELNQKLAASLEESRAHEDELVKKLEVLFTKSLEGVNKKLADLRMRSFAGGGGGGGGNAGLENVEFRPSQATIESLFANELESNVKAMQQTEGKQGGKIGSALDKLRAMRGGGGAKPPPADEKK